ncbi:hypothetical protein HDU98_007783 [Podochytrium sp. JEL0797]|nr:hypothetical protein HDU98_007783 [Podochytrium sp. JEL0797]
MNPSTTAWKPPTDGGWSFQLLGPQTKVGAGAQWYLRAANSINGQQGLNPTAAQIKEMNQPAVQGNPKEAGIGVTGGGTAGVSGNVGNHSVGVVPGVNTTGLVHASAISGDATPSWKVPTVIGAVIGVIIVVFAVGSFIYTKLKKPEKEELVTNENQENLFKQESRAASELPPKFATAPPPPQYAEGRESIALSLIEQYARDVYPHQVAYQQRYGQSDSFAHQKAFTSGHSMAGSEVYSVHAENEVPPGLVHVQHLYPRRNSGHQQQHQQQQHYFPMHLTADVSSVEPFVPFYHDNSRVQRRQSFVPLYQPMEKMNQARRRRSREEHTD